MPWNITKWIKYKLLFVLPKNACFAKGNVLLWLQSFY